MNQQLDQIKTALPGLIPNCGDCVVITIDGPAGSGKTTLALTLEGEKSLSAASSPNLLAYLNILGAILIESKIILGIIIKFKFLVII